MKIGIFGLGSIGSRHIRNLHLMGERDVLGYDPRVGQAGFSPTVECQTTSAEHLLWGWRPEVVLVCTPPRTHFAITYTAIDHGASVFTEKPLALRAINARMLCQKAKDRHRLLACGYQLRAHPGVQQFPRDWRSLHIWDRQDMSAWPAASYRRELLEEYSHELDLALFWAGEYPDTAEAHWPSPELCVIDMAWPDGRTAMIELATGRTEYERGASSGRAHWVFQHGVNDVAYSNELKAFLSGEPYCTGVDAAQTVRLIEALS